MSSLSEKSAFEAFARMEEKIETNVRMVAASAEIDAEFRGDKLSEEFKQLERGASGADAESRLLALKQKMGVLPPPAPAADRQLGAGGGAGQRPALGSGVPAAQARTAAPRRRRPCPRWATARRCDSARPPGRRRKRRCSPSSRSSRRSAGAHERPVNDRRATHER
jgi:hypothetical protein